jgi:hypothetical protein
VQLDRRLGSCRLQHLYIGGDVDRLDVGELADLVLLDPGKEVAGGPVIGHAGVLVADGGSEELEEPPGRVIAAPAITAGTANALRNVAALTGGAASMTASRLSRSALTTTPYK